MSTCCCRGVLAILVIVFAWLPYPWTPYALTVVGALLVIMSLGGVCCCASKREASCATTGTDAESGE